MANHSKFGPIPYPRWNVTSVRGAIMAHRGTA